MATDARAKPVRAAVFATIDRADVAVERLLEAGFRREQISVLCSNKAKEAHFGDLAKHQEPAGEHAVESATAGSAFGAALGTLTSIGLTTAAGISILAAGPSFIIGGAIAGGLIGAMTTRGEEKEVADFYDQSVSRGRILVAVEDQSENAEEMLTRAERVFESVGADPIPLTDG